MAVRRSNPISTSSLNTFGCQRFADISGNTPSALTLWSRRDNGVEFLNTTDLAKLIRECYEIT